MYTTPLYCTGTLYTCSYTVSGAIRTGCGALPDGAAASSAVADGHVGQGVAEPEQAGHAGQVVGHSGAGGHAPLCKLGARARKHNVQVESTVISYILFTMNL